MKHQAVDALDPTPTVTTGLLDGVDDRSGRAPSRDDLRRAIDQAVQAPSSHNTQPWRFRLQGPVIELRADRTRSLPVVDPDDRELTMSCGCALFHLRTALRSRGFDVDVARLVDPGDPDLLARVTVRPGPPPTADEATLGEALGRRHTSRAPYLGLTVPDDVIEALRRDVEAEGAWLAPLSAEAERVRLVALVMDADHQQWGSPRFRDELARWLRTNDSAARDGIFGYATGLDNVSSHLAAIAVRLLDRGSREAVAHRDLVDASPLLAVLGTDGDGPLDWLRAGEALDRALLRAESEDLRVAYLNQPLEVAGLREPVRELTGRSGCAQVVLRVGYGPAGLATPRRAVDDVMIGDATP